VWGCALCGWGCDVLPRPIAINTWSSATDRGKPLCKIGGCAQSEVRGTARLGIGLPYSEYDGEIDRGWRSVGIVFGAGRVGEKDGRDLVVDRRVEQDVDMGHTDRPQVKTACPSLGPEANRRSGWEKAQRHPVWHVVGSNQALIVAGQIPANHPVRGFQAAKFEFPTFVAFIVFRRVTFGQSTTIVGIHRTVRSFGVLGGNKRKCWDQQECNHHQHKGESLCRHSSPLS
jgi:hypothetical protein